MDHQCDGGAAQGNAVEKQHVGRAEILLLYCGQLWYLLGRYHRAIRDFTERMERCPEWNCFWERGWAYRRLGDWQRAEQDFEEDGKRWGTSNSVTTTG